MVNELELACQNEKNLAERLLQIFAKYKTPLCEEKIKMETYNRIKAALQSIKGVETAFAAKLAASTSMNQTETQAYGRMFISIPVTLAKIQLNHQPKIGTYYSKPMAG